MPNPIFGGFSGRPQQPQQSQQTGPNSIFGVMNQIRNSPNPNAAMQSMLSSNPMFKGIVDYINQNGGDAKTAFYNMAAQKGVDPESILKQLR